MITYKIPEPCIDPVSVYIFPLDNGLWVANFGIIDKPRRIRFWVAYRFSAQIEPEKIGKGSIQNAADRSLVFLHTGHKRGDHCDVITSEGMISSNRDEAFKWSENTVYQCAPIDGDYFPDTTEEQRLVKRIISIRFGIHIDDGTLGVISGERSTMLRISDQEIVDPVVSLDGSTIAMCVPKYRQIILIDNPLAGE